MKEGYLHPVVVSANAIEGEGVVPLVIGGITIKAAAALLAGFMAGRAATKVMEARPTFKLPSLTKGELIENNI